MMKKISNWLMASVAMATVAMGFTSCDDDHWRDDWGWNDPYSWYGSYGDYGWNNNDWNSGTQGGDESDSRTQEAQMLCGEWGGIMNYSYINSDNTSRTTDKFYADMKFYQYNQNTNSYSGEGIEVDYQLTSDNLPDYTQMSDPLYFSWYIESDGDIVIQYKKTLATFVLDSESTVAGFFLGRENNKTVDTFFGYMIGTGTVSGDVINFDFERLNAATTNAKAFGAGKQTEKTVSFGQGATFTPLIGTKATKFNNRR